ncbi:MAG TPA: DEAD/DEAH box helicase [Microlunatus sp.]
MSVPASSSSRARKSGPPNTPKNTRADGGRKRRWSADERSDRGRPPRRSSGRTERIERSGASRSSRPADARGSFRSDAPRRELRKDSFRSDSLREDRTPQSDQMTWEEPTAHDLDLVAASPDSHESGSSGFAELGLPAGLVQNLRAAGITSPFPIQAATVPDALAGRDVLGRARTGSGKTLGFGLPMIVRLTNSSSVSRQPRGIVLVPTRELALQVADVLAPLARSQGLKVALVTGGMAYGPQIRALDTGTDIVVATPGRLIDLMEQGVADLGRVEITVLDEADHMADLGFMPAVTQILRAVPAGGQRMLFSATLDRAVDQLVRTYLSNPVTHSVDPGQASITLMEHRLIEVAPADKVAMTAELARRGERTVIFVRTQRGADRVAEQLREAGVLAGALHGGLTQGARARILAAFKEGRLPVLVATDVAARGIHVDSIGLVLQADPPSGPKDYLHRAGRTARAGQAGKVLTLVLPPQRRDVRRLVAQAGVSAVHQPGRLGESWLAEVGPEAGVGPAVTRAEFDRLIAPAPSPRGRGRSDRRGPKSVHRGARARQR